VSTENMLGSLSASGTPARMVEYLLQGSTLNRMVAGTSVDTDALQLGDVGMNDHDKVDLDDRSLVKFRSGRFVGVFYFGTLGLERVRRQAANRSVLGRSSRYCFRCQLETGSRLEIDSARHDEEISTLVHPKPKALRT
jgi:hypothetical protein